MKRINMKRPFLFAISSIVLLTACNSGKNSANNKKEADIYFEESFKPVFETSIYTYESQHDNSTIKAHYVSESDAFDAFINGKTSTICVTRDFTEAEKKSLLAKQNVQVRSTKVAIDAIALIIHPENTDTLMTVDRIKNIINGKDTIWHGSNRRINVVFDNPNSANFIYLKKLSEMSSLPVNVFAVHSNEEVINYVKDNRNALGIIGVNWISDEEDPETLDFLDGINVVEVAKEEGGEYFKPFQAYIYDEYYTNNGYPLVRDVWFINKAGNTSVNSSFVNFMNGEKGQLIIQKSSLLPANLVARMINFTTE